MIATVMTTTPKALHQIISLQTSNDFVMYKEYVEVDLLLCVVDAVIVTGCSRLSLSPISKSITSNVSSRLTISVSAAAAGRALMFGWRDIDKTLKICGLNLTYK
eukprot:CAMPEP_0114435888 /NCGR_PEP_ID=MMETSP0103-20121206/13110_1 /TAXON_ID=37642 ORGANISM="Paraphysomonas imperforata, Strain PA2" /NCGR_SAMPLE_ID=MMETSP0103 /ASSEMBLY_ACC=CAM_ASM_000201 /LENGTH=103 /DNA_ID=CAMNT_0001606023 /DNA_START=211 /DNA_END=519 /DNA_ORIENTATION=-